MALKCAYGYFHRSDKKFLQCRKFNGVGVLFWYFFLPFKFSEAENMRRNSNDISVLFQIITFSSPSKLK